MCAQGRGRTEPSRPQPRGFYLFPRLIFKSLRVSVLRGAFVCRGGAARHLCPLAERKRGKKKKPPKPKQLQPRTSLPQPGDGFMFRKANVLGGSRDEPSPRCPLPFPRGSSCPGCAAQNGPFIEAQGPCVYGLASPPGLGICFDIQLQERVPPPSWFCTQSALSPLGTWLYKQRANSRQLLKQNPLLRWLLKWGVYTVFTLSVGKDF